LGLKDYSVCETARILKEIREAMTTGSPVERTRSGLNNHSGFGDNKIGRHDYRANEPNSTFAIAGRTMTAAQFGNFAAGYAGYYYDGPYGLGMVMWAGVGYDADEDYRMRLSGISTGEDFDFDFDSRNDLRDGALRAKNEIKNGVKACGCARGGK
jgi:hypothetical protein